MRGADGPIRAPKVLFTFNSRDDIQLYATGCDGDIGGRSTVHIDLDENPEHNAHIGKAATGVFWGEMRLDVKPGMEGKILPGWAGFRNKTRPTMFGNMLEDVSGHRYLGLRLRMAGDPATHNSYYVNIQTDGPISTDLWQHRLFMRRETTWEDVFIPFTNFIRTNTGEVSEDQISMYSSKIRSIGISMLGGKSNVAGSYELGIDSIWAINEEDLPNKHSLKANIDEQLSEKSRA